MRTITFVTSNANKLAVAREHLGRFGIAVEHVAVELDELQAVTVEEVARYKVRQAEAIVAGPVFIEDAGFYIDELGFPGPLVKPVVAMIGAAGLARLADLTQTRRCHFESVLAYRGEGQHLVLTDEGSTGTIAALPHGTPTPGSWSAIWDIYIPDGYDRPASALTTTENEARFDRWAQRSVYAQLGERLTTGEATGATTGSGPRCCAGSPRIRGTSTW